MPGLEKILRGILKYQATLRPEMVHEFEKVKDNPEPVAVLFSCMDSRLVISRLLQSSVGDMFSIRNAGNLVPHHDCLSYDSVTTEPGALELGCIVNKIRHIMVCGHTDCKAMNLLFSIKDKMADHSGTPLVLWMKKHGQRTVDKYNAWKEGGGKSAIIFQAESADKLFEAYIDPENQFAEVDKFSQINTLQQLQNIASHPIIHDKIANDEVRLNALWFDIYKGNFFMFSRSRKQFIPVTEESYDHLFEDGK
ncbi:hypothetical protein LSH36_554g01003 [Paralvinella palmiformis]|uniref:Carbonic anhydrase n=1 Tax=Paralvinella palmiformis TaxID=53620 RepID=A0AAD9J6L2_9ANNE|nr:hypothetical protein LSH36_554g01003 [Paralvinella palmiformis]